MKGGNTMEIKELEADYSYDSRLDVVNIEIKQDYQYEVSVDLQAGVYLHFDTDYFPVGLEIIDASKKIGVSKEFLADPSGNVKIIISKDSINVEVTFQNNEVNGLLKLDTFGEPFLPDLETNFALV